MSKYAKQHRGGYPQWYKINRVEDGELLGTLREEYVKCGKAGCKCAEGELHGPYWYRYWRENTGRLRKSYVKREDVQKVESMIDRRRERLRRERADRNAHMHRGMGLGFSANTWRLINRWL